MWDFKGEKCEACQDKCESCKNSNSCLTCVDDGPFRSSAPDCNCAAGTYDKDGKSCSECSIVCETCVDKASNCEICKDKER